MNFQSSSVKAFVTLFSRLVIALTGIVFVPIYVRLIGLESYGLVAFFSTLVGSLAILDLGLSTAISRQVAILKVHEGKEKEMRDLVYSVEIIYWMIAFGVGLLIVALAHPIALYWVKAKDLPAPVIERTVMLMGAVFAFQFPTSIYNGIMNGFEKQIPNAIINMLFTVLKSAGVIFVLKLIAPTIGNFFIWQVFMTILLTFILRLYIWKYLISRGRAYFSKIQLKNIWRFAAGMTGISLITFFLTQIDKIVVSKMVLLEFVGYYNLAFTLSGGISQVVAPLQQVIFPKFTSLVAQRKNSELIALYHKSCRWVSIIVFPIGFLLVFFAHDLLILWTKNPVLTANTAPILQVFAAGTICNCMLLMPYIFLLAKGITRFTIIQNVVASIILVPLLFWWTPKYGAIGASFVWLSVNAGYILITIPLFHNLFLKGELWNWYKNDVALPLLAAGLISVAAKLVQHQILNGSAIDWRIFGVMIVTMLIIYILVIPELRGYARRARFNFKS